MTVDLYREIVAITEDYLGPAAERFIARQIAFHLEKAPREITRGDVPKLIEWTRVTLALLTDDKEIVRQYAERMERLATTA